MHTQWNGRSDVYFDVECEFILVNPKCVMCFCCGVGFCCGLDKYIYDYKGTIDGLITLCEWYILVQIMLTGIFGIDKRLTEVLTDRDCYGQDVSTSSVVSFIISNIFDNDLASFKELITYCIQDIQHNDNNIKKFKKMYKSVLKKVQRNDQELKHQHKLVALDYRGWNWNDFTCEMSKLIGVNMNWKDGNGNDITNIAGEDVMLLVLECVKSLVKLKWQSQLIY